jgi:hypothetical protein
MKKVLLPHANAIKVKLKQLSLAAAPMPTRKSAIFDELDKLINSLSSGFYKCDEVFEALLDCRSGVPNNVNLFGLQAKQMARIIIYDLVFASQNTKELLVGLTTVFSRLNGLPSMAASSEAIDQNIDWIINTIDFRLTRIAPKYKESFVDCVWVHLSKGLVPPPSRAILQAPYSWYESEKIKWLKFYSWLKIAEVLRAGGSIQAFEDFIIRVIDCCPDDCSHLKTNDGDEDSSSSNSIEVSNNPKPKPFRKDKV